MSEQRGGRDGPCADLDIRRRKDIPTRLIERALSFELVGGVDERRRVEGKSRGGVGRNGSRADFLLSRKDIPTRSIARVIA